MKTLRAWHHRGAWYFVGRIAGIGACSGVAAWLLAIALQRVFDVPRPTLMALVWAIPRGALYGAILAIALHLYWSRSDTRTRDVT